MDFNLRLRSLRKEKHLTQADVGKPLGYGYTTISNYESGRNEPSIEDLKKIAVFFDVSLDYLLGVTDQRQAYGVTTADPLLARLVAAYEKLDEKGREELAMLLQWLEAHPSADASCAPLLLKVAQTVEPYGTRSPKNTGKE